jgi:hypothetical protein
MPQSYQSDTKLLPSGWRCCSIAYENRDRLGVTPRASSTHAYGHTRAALLDQNLFPRYQKTISNPIVIATSTNRTTAGLITDLAPLSIHARFRISGTRSSHSAIRFRHATHVISSACQLVPPIAAWPSGSREPDKPHAVLKVSKSPRSR